MSFCSECGVVFHIDDTAVHECNPSEIPQKGEEVSGGKKRLLNSWKSQ